MIAIVNTFNSIFNPYDHIQVNSSNEDVYEYAVKSDCSTKLWTFINSPPKLFFLPTLYDSSQVYLNDKFIGYYYQQQIDDQNQNVTYDLSLLDESVLPEKFDFHFEENDISFAKVLSSGKMIAFNKKMIIDPISSTDQA